MIPLIISAMFAWYPTIDGQRVQLDAQAQNPYWLGVSCPPREIIDCTAFQGHSRLFDLDDFTGTDWYLYRVTLPEPVKFYSEGNYVGQIVPEPVTFLMVLFGTMFVGKRKIKEK